MFYALRSSSPLFLSSRAHSFPFGGSPRACPPLSAAKFQAALKLSACRGPDEESDRATREDTARGAFCRVFRIASSILPFSVQWKSLDEWNDVCLFNICMHYGTVSGFSVFFVCLFFFVFCFFFFATYVKFPAVNELLNVALSARTFTQTGLDLNSLTLRHWDANLNFFSPHPIPSLREACLRR